MKKYSARLPSPKQFGLRLRSNLRNRRFARKSVLACRLSRRCQALHFTGFSAAVQVIFTQKA
ncbi:hypothetical protein EAI77_07030 [Ligilactobacillus ruminis]|nr:hypothetical protein EAI77_07030 [Ligilactobacillus ruminis]